MPDNRPLLVDLFCGAGGASMGYARAGFRVIGVDWSAQPHYPFEFIRADALEYDIPSDTAVVAASPPCQAYTTLQSAPTHARLIEPTREKLQATKLPYVIENVAGARWDLINPIMLCGTMFGLHCTGLTEYTSYQLQRHRYFESNVPLSVPFKCNHQTYAIGVYGKGTQNGATRAECREAMGIDWMTHPELVESIPPTYTEWIGGEIMRGTRVG